MSTLKSQKPFFAHVDAAVKLAKAIEADAILVLLEKNVAAKALQESVANWAGNRRNDFGKDHRIR